MREQRAIGRLIGLCAALFVCAVLFSKTAFAADTAINATNFPDYGFREWVSTEVDTNGNGKLSDAEKSSITNITITSSPIQSLKGIEFFTNLQKLKFQGEIMGRLDLSKNTALKEVRLEWAYGLTSIDVSKCPNLDFLQIEHSSITQIDLSKNTKLQYLMLDYCMLTQLNVSKNTRLTKLSCTGNRITSLSLGGLANLEKLECADNCLTTLDVSGNKELEELFCQNNALTSLRLPVEGMLKTINCMYNQLKSLDISNTSVDTLLSCGNLLTEKTLRLNTILEPLREKFTMEAHLSTVSFGNASMAVRKNSAIEDGRLDEDYHVDAGQDVRVFYYRGDYDSVVEDRWPAGSAYTIKNYSFTANECYFLGWALSPGCTQPQFKTGSKITMYRDTILFPVLKPKTCKVTFDLNGGTSGAPATVTCMMDVYVEVPSSSPVREGYYFLGWAETKNATTADYKSGDAVSVWLGNVTLYAVWKARNNTITFNANGGSGTVPSPIKVLTGNQAVIPKANLTRSGYWFLGWSTSQNATTATYKSGDKISVKKDTTLYAVWKSSGTTNCTLTFNANGGSGAPAAITAAKDSTVTIPKASVSRSGFWFLGWATTKNATSAQYKSGDTLKLSASTTLYAVWKKK